MSNEELRTKDELTMLRQRVKLQRKELRRLNTQIQAMWKGWNYHAHIERELEFRRKMIASFGFESVNKAEREPIPPQPFTEAERLARKYPPPRKSDKWFSLAGLLLAAAFIYWYIR